MNLLTECTNTSGLGDILWHWPLQFDYVLCKEVLYFVSILWQTDSLSVPQLSCYDKIIISIYFMCAAQDIWVLNQMPLIHFLSHLNSHGLAALGDWAYVICCYFTFYGDRESTASNTQNMFAWRHNDAFWFSLRALLKLSGFSPVLETEMKYSQKNKKGSPTSPLCWVKLANNYLRTFS